MKKKFFEFSLKLFKISPYCIQLVLYIPSLLLFVVAAKLVPIIFVLYCLVDILYLKILNTDTMIIWFISIAFLKLIINVAIIKRINKYVSIQWPLFLCRSLNQDTIWKPKNQNVNLLFEKFIDALECFIRGEIKVCVKPIKSLNIRTHKYVIIKILRKYGIQNTDINNLLKADKKIRAKEIFYNNKTITIKVKYNKTRFIVEEAILKRNPFKYMWINFEGMYKEEYKVKININ